MERAWEMEEGEESAGEGNNAGDDERAREGANKGKVGGEEERGMERQIFYC